VAEEISQIPGLVKERLGSRKRPARPAARGSVSSA
jgi:hypothetical protein